MTGLSTPKRIISNHAGWLEIKKQFPNKSAYREFRRDHAFDPDAQIILTGKPIDEVVRAGTTHRRRIFEECFTYGRTIREVNELAKTMPGQAEQDADLFLGLHTDFIRLFE